MSAFEVITVDNRLLLALQLMNDGTDSLGLNTLWCKVTQWKLLHLIADLVQNGYDVLSFQLLQMTLFCAPSNQGFEAPKPDLRELTRPAYKKGNYG